MTEKKMNHINDVGEAHMVDVSDKTITKRVAIAESSVEMKQETLQEIVKGNMKKGDVIAVARIAGITAAKQCANLIPLCHPLALDSVEVDIKPDSKNNKITIQATVKTTGKTGVEMEALTAVSITALAIYDMAKAIDKNMIIKDTKLIMKKKGNEK